MKYQIIQNRDAGFFSDFNMILANLMYFNENKISNFNIIWRNNKYQSNISENIFEKYFFNQKQFNQYDYTYNAQYLSEGIFQPVMPTNTLKRLNKTLRHFNYFDNEVFKACSSVAGRLRKCLGVHIRQTDHGYHGQLLDLENYINAIDEKLETGKYKQLFLATDELRILHAVKRKYGKFLIYNPIVTRSTDGTAIHFSDCQNREKLALDVLQDGIALSNCDEILITASNVSTFALCISPNTPYTLLDRHISYT